MIYYDQSGVLFMIDENYRKYAIVIEPLGSMGIDGEIVAPYLGEILKQCDLIILDDEVKQEVMDGKCPLMDEDDFASELLGCDLDDIEEIEILDIVDWWDNLECSEEDEEAMFMAFEALFEE